MGHYVRSVAPLEKEIERVLENMLDDFPELSPLVGSRGKRESSGGRIPDFESSFMKEIIEGENAEKSDQNREDTMPNLPEGETTNEKAESFLEQPERESKPKRPGLMVGFEEVPERNELGRLTENTIWINKGHPAYRKAMECGAGEYHLVLSVAWVLSGYLEGEKSPQDFINRFLSNWGTGLIQTK